MMVKIKLCGLSRPRDIEVVNELRPEYIGFVFAPKSRRYILPQRAKELRQLLAPGIRAVGVFVNEKPEYIARLLAEEVIDIAQLHGKENEAYLARLRKLTGAALIQAFPINSPQDVKAAQESTADMLLLDSGPGGTGSAFDWTLLRELRRPYFLAGGLTAENAAQAVGFLHPYGVDVSSGIETGGKKDPCKMEQFVRAVRGAQRKEGIL